MRLRCPLHTPFRRGTRSPETRQWPAKLAPSDPPLEHRSTCAAGASGGGDGGSIRHPRYPARVFRLLLPSTVRVAREGDGARPRGEGGEAARGAHTPSRLARYAFSNCPVAEMINLSPQADRVVPYFGDIFTDEPLPANGFIDLPDRRVRRVRSRAAGVGARRALGAHSSPRDCVLSPRLQCCIHTVTDRDPCI